MAFDPDQQFNEAQADKDDDVPPFGEFVFEPKFY